jgi:hypothetical protein
LVSQRSPRTTSSMRCKSGEHPGHVSDASVLCYFCLVRGVVAGLVLGGRRGESSVARGECEGVREGVMKGEKGARKRRVQRMGGT